MIEQQSQQEDLVIETREATLRAILAVPEKARSIVLFAHGAGSGRRNHIDAYSFGRIRVSGDDFDEDLIVFPDKVEPYWKRREAHTLSLPDLETVIDYSPDLLVVGTGVGGRLHLDPTMRETLRQKGIDCIEEHTDRAWQIFNDQIEHDRKVVGAFHLTC